MSKVVDDGKSITVDAEGRNISLTSCGLSSAEEEAVQTDLLLISITHSVFDTRELI